MKGTVGHHILIGTDGNNCFYIVFIYQKSCEFFLCNIIIILSTYTRIKSCQQADEPTVNSERQLLPEKYSSTENYLWWKVALLTPPSVPLCLFTI